jgi:hypothetical protein
VIVLIFPSKKIQYLRYPNQKNLLFYEFLLFKIQKAAPKTACKPRNTTKLLKFKTVSAEYILILSIGFERQISSWGESAKNIASQGEATGDVEGKIPASHSDPNLAGALSR